ncbi:MAG TPA: DUF5658 family protein [Fimbriimonadales bacterium]|nr:DUF5658 family protein [Fimbriimonadales bacterium]
MATAMSLPQRLADHFRRGVPSAILLYAVLSLLDYGFTLAALTEGALELNPALSWFHSQGLFEFVKLSLTLLVCCTAYKIWDKPYVQALMRIANTVMGVVFVYHIILRFL